MAAGSKSRRVKEAKAPNGDERGRAGRGRRFSRSEQELALGIVGERAQKGWQGWGAKGESPKTKQARGEQ